MVLQKFFSHFSAWLSLKLIDQFLFWYLNLSRFLIVERQCWLSLVHNLIFHSILAVCCVLELENILRLLRLLYIIGCFSPCFFLLIIFVTIIILKKFHVTYICWIIIILALKQAFDLYKYLLKIIFNIIQFLDSDLWVRKYQIINV
jgi:hypothetical protein